MNVKHNSLQSQLLQARSEGLQRASGHALRPLGKLWGMDVFTWYAPSVYELSATIQAFPFPVFWMATDRQLKEMAALDSETFRLVTWIAQYNSAELGLPADVLPSSLFATATDGLEDTFELLKNKRSAQHILLFTAVGNEWKTHMQLFEQFVQQHQAK
jgi:hypothetical protein